MPNDIYLPGIAGGTVRLKAVTVAKAISCGEAFVLQDAPGVTMFGFKRVP